MRRLRDNIISFLAHKAVRQLLLRIVVVNVVFVISVFLLSIFFDFEEIHQSISLLQDLEFQTAFILAVGLIEGVILASIVAQWLYQQNFAALPIKKLIADGENELVEFKSSLRWDYKEKHTNKELEYVIAKTIAGFMNSKGGTLLIGVDDDKNLIGLEKDFNTLKKKNRDGFMLHLNQVVNNCLGKEYFRFVSISMARLGGRDVCRIDILPAASPVYLYYNGHQEFFIREAASTQPLEIREAHDYIKMHWGK
jgi:hypothetical protein